MEENELSSTDIYHEQTPETLQPPQLSSREVEILKLAASGTKINEVAKALPEQLNNQTVKNIIYGDKSYPGILQKLKAPSVSAALVSALKQNYFDVQSIEIKTIHTDQVPEANTLSKIQKAALIWEAKGLATPEIAEKLELSTDYINKLFATRRYGIGLIGIYERLGCVSSRPAAIARALQLGIITLEEI